MALWPHLERRFIFFPTREIEYTPASLGVEYEDVYFTTQDGHRLHGWFVPGSSDITWLWFHGNGGNISHRADEVALINRRLGANVFIFDYRGYGKSAGQPSEGGTYRDARAALQYLLERPDVEQDKIVYFGRSLGAAVAVELAAAHREPQGLVLVAPFSSLADMARVAYPFLPAHWLVRNKYDSLSRIPQVTSPVLVLHGDGDEIVPLAQGRKLYEAANHPKEFRVLPGAGHNDTFINGGEPYWESLSLFLGTLQDRSVAD